MFKIPSKHIQIEAFLRNIVGFNSILFFFERVIEERQKMLYNLIPTKFSVFPSNQGKLNTYGVA